MLFSKLICLILPLMTQASALSSSLIEKRTYSQIFADEQNLNASYYQFTKTVDACTCTSAQGQALFTSISALRAAHAKLQDDCKATTTVFTAAQCEQYTNYSNNPLLVTVTTSVNSLIKRKTQFDYYGLTVIVRNLLCQIQKYLANIRPCIVGKCPTSQQGKNAAAFDKIQAQITRAQQIYGTTTSCTI